MEKEIQKLINCPPGYGKYSKNLGVIEKDKYKVTDLERTLIDITVRPQYSGGVKNTLNGFCKAKGKIDIERLSSLLKRLKFIYPYHQALGFYLEKSGYNDEELEPLFNVKMKFNFYLTYKMNSTLYSNKWRLYYPKNLE